MKTWFFTILLLFIIGISGTITQTSNAQTDNGNITTSEQITLSDDLLSDPVAQELLKKIELSRKMIAELEQKEYEDNQAKKNLEEMRTLSLEMLKKDLAEWERLWESHTPRNAFSSFVSKKPEYVQGVFWDQFEFKEQKVKAGREALKQVLLNGGSLKEARAAYYKAAATKLVELIEMNIQFNVKHNLAYYDQQQLFNSTGQFHLSPTSQKKITQYYTDYRLDPAYLLANPEDDYSANYGSNTNPDTKCREGYLVIYRIKSNDYACITKSTAQMWERHGIGEIVNEDKSQLFFDENSLVQNVKTNPGTQCREGYSVLYHIPTSEYKCVSEITAKEWLENGTGEVHDLLQYVSGKDLYKIVLDKIYEINQEIIKLDEENALKQVQLESEYVDILNNADISTKQAEKEIMKEYHSSSTMTKEELSKKIIELRDLHDSKKEQIFEEKSNAKSNLESKLKDKMLSIAQRYEKNSDVNVIWNTDKSTYEAVPRR